MRYDPKTGVLTRLTSWRKDHPVGAIINGTNSNGYIVTKIDGVRHAAHHLAWLYVYGVWPDRIVDHINGDITDNRIANLRLANDGESALNRKRRTNNTSGYKGVHWADDAPRKGPWRASISLHGHRVPLGCFWTAEEAGAAYERAAKKLHGDFRRKEQGP